MTRVERSALVLHSAQAMYELVNDVARYPEFLPWCSGAQVLSQEGDTMVARVDVAKAGLRYSFTTRNRLEPGRSIHMSLVEGPFSALEGTWSFTPLDADACKVELKLSFDFVGKLAGVAMGKVFNQIALAMMDAFCKRADQRYGGAR